jgi:DNA-binding LacI/PurR family transcriptional regulator
MGVVEPSSNRVTLRDVAAASGVSRATVSFVLNDRPDQTISAATRERVRNAAAELGYVPHGIARALAEGVSRIVVLNVDSRMAGNYARSFIRGLGDELATHGHILLVRYGDATPAQAKQVLDTVAPRAVLDMGNPYSSGYPLEDAGGGWRDGLAAHSAAQIRYLAEIGHMSLGMPMPGTATTFSDVRLRFATEVAAELGISAPVPCLLPADREACAVAVAAVIDAHPDISAFAAVDDEHALKAIAALHDLGVSVPDEVAVIGYDETEYAAFAQPALTTVHIDAEAHGRVLARRALDLDPTDVESTPGLVVVRESA